jgi:hypothetical protein
MVALDLDDAVLRGAAGSALALEVARDRLQIAGRDAACDRDRLAAATARFLRDADDAVVRRWRRGAATGPRV